MKTIKLIVSLTVAMSTFLLVGCSSPSKPAPPEAVNGVIDLSDWDFDAIALDKVGDAHKSLTT